MENVYFRIFKDSAASVFLLQMSLKTANSKHGMILFVVCNLSIQLQSEEKTTHE